MIAAVRFLAPPASGQREDGNSPPRSSSRAGLLVTDGGEAPRVWALDPLTAAAPSCGRWNWPRREATGRVEDAEVVGGLNPTDKLIATGREGLASPGKPRVRVVGEDR